MLRYNLHSMWWNVYFGEFWQMYTSYPPHPRNQNANHSEKWCQQDGWIGNHSVSPLPMMSNTSTIHKPTLFLRNPEIRRLLYPRWLKIVLPKLVAKFVAFTYHSAWSWLGWVDRENIPSSMVLHREKKGRLDTKSNVPEFSGTAQVISFGPGWL